MKVKIMDPEHGDQVLELTPKQAARTILTRRADGKVAFVKFSDGTQMDLPEVPKFYFASQILAMMENTGILQQLEEKDRLDVDATLVPAVAGG